MDRQQEYELRKNISEAMKQEVEQMILEKTTSMNHNFFFEILVPLIIVEQKFHMKSMESIMHGRMETNEYLLLVNPVREAVYWYLHKVFAIERNISFDYDYRIPDEDVAYRIIEIIMKLYDEYKRGEQISQIRESPSKVLIKPEGDDIYGFYFPTVSEKYEKELLYYYGLDDTMRMEVEREVVIESENYLNEKMNLRDLLVQPQKIHIYYNIIDGMTRSIDNTFFELCRKRVLIDINKISSSTIRSVDDSNTVIIDTKEELSRFLGLLYYLSRIAIQKYAMADATKVGKTEYVCVYDDFKLYALGKKVGISKEAMKRYIDYFSMDTNVFGGNFTEFPLIQVGNKVIWIPSSILLNDFQFSIVNGHYYKRIRFEEKDNTVSQSIIDYIVEQAKKYSNIIYSTNYIYSVPEEEYNGKPLNSDIDVAIYDRTGKKLLIIECKWKENVYQNKEDYIKIQDALKKIYERQLGKHKKYLCGDITRISGVFGNQIDFRYEGEIDTMYLFVDKRVQLHDCKMNYHVISSFMLAYLFNENSKEGYLNLSGVFSSIRSLESHIEYERVRLKQPVKIGSITLE